MIFKDWLIDLVMKYLVKENLETKKYLYLSNVVFDEVRIRIGFEKNFKLVVVFF